MNRDEALRCKSISQGYLAEGNRELALKYAQKAFYLFESEETKAWLEQVTEKPKSERRHSSTSTASTASTGSNASVEIRRILRIDQHDYYGILGVTRGASDADIKKAYRKLALILHPDKCQEAGSDEAFKLVSRAFSILSEPGKRNLFDQTGAADGHQPHRHAAWAEGEMSPEEIFKAFFGEHFQPRGHPFVYVHRFGGGFGSRQRQQQPQPTFWQQVIGWFPVIFFVAFVLLNLIFGSHTPRTPTRMEDIAEHVSLQRTWSHWYPRETVNLHVPYWCTANYRDHFASNTGDTNLSLYEDIIERHHVHSLQQACRRETIRLQERIKRAKGEKLAELQAEVPSPCAELHRLGVQ